MFRKFGRLAGAATFFIGCGLGGLSNVNADVPTPIPAGVFIDQNKGLIDWYSSKSITNLLPNEPIIIAMHGYKDHAWAYTENPDMPLLKGLPENRLVVAFNQPTFGATSKDPRPKENVTSVKEFSERYGKFVDFIAKKYPENPIVLLGHSLGGQVVARYLEDTYRWTPKNIKFALLSSPALGLPPDFLERYVKAPLAKAIGSVPGLRRLPVLPDFLNPKKMADPTVGEFFVAGPSIDSFADEVELERAGNQDSGWNDWQKQWKEYRERSKAASEFKADPRARHALHNWSSARATLVGMKELESLMAQRNAPLPFPVVVSHYDGDKITTPEASFKYIEALRAKELAHQTPYQSVWENGLELSKTTLTFLPPGTQSVKTFKRHAVPTFNQAPAAIQRLFERNGSLAEVFGHSRAEIQLASSQVRYRIQRSRIPLLFKPRLKAFR